MKTQRIIGIFILSLLMYRVFCGCYTPKKAQQQTEKAAAKYPDAVAKIARDKFPCTTGDTILKESTDSNLFFISLADVSALLTDAQLKIDSLNYEVYLASTCGDSLHIYQAIAAEQADEIIKMNGAFNNIKPVIKYRDRIIPVEDSAKIKLLSGELARFSRDCNESMIKKDAKIDQLQASADSWRKKAKRRWWIIAAIVILLVGVNYLRIKKKIPI